MPTNVKPFKFTRSDEFFKVSQFLLRFMFVTIKTDTNHVSKFKFGPLFWGAMPTLCALVLLSIAFIYFLIKTGFRFELFCFAMCTTCYQYTAFSKAISIARSSSKLNNLFVILNEIHPKTREEQMEYQIRDWLNKTVRIMLFYAMIQIIMIANYVIIPFYGYIKVYITTGVWKMNLLLLFWLPFDTDTVLAFYFVYSVQGWVAFSTSLCIASCDLLLMAIVQLCCAHFTYIQQTLNKLPTSKANPLNDVKMIKSCIDKQNIIIQYVFDWFTSLFLVNFFWTEPTFFQIFLNRISREINEIFYISNLLNYVSISISICTIGCLLLIEDLGDDFFMYAFTMQTFLCQIFFIAWIGDKLTQTVCMIYTKFLKLFCVGVSMSIV